MRSEVIETAIAPSNQTLSSFFGKSLNLSPASIAVTFALLGTGWVLATCLFLNANLIGIISPFKLHIIFATTFVLLSAAALYFLIREYSTSISISRDLITKVFEISPIGIAVIRQPDNLILLANLRFETLSGYSLQELIGRSTTDLKLWSCAEEWLKFTERIRDKEAIEGFESTFRRADGKLFPGIITARQFSFMEQPCTLAFIEDTTEQQQSADQIEELTHYDAITGLPNQKLLTERLNHLITISNREGRGLAVLVLSLARCPQAINSLGHEICDEIMRTLAKRSREKLRETDTLAVLEKEKLGVILPMMENERDLLPVVTKLLDSISEPIELDEAEFQLHAHIGIAIFPSDGRTSEVLQKHAHLAMTQAQKQTDENSFQFYAEEMNKTTNEQLQIESSIIKGIRNGEFFVCYQPQFNSDGTRLVGMEALARWKHPELGMIGPDKFIPVSESNGTIVPLGEQIMELALTNCQNWRQNGFPELTVSVNVSPRQLKNRQFIDKLKQLLVLTGLPPEYLSIELTESVLLEHSDENTEQIFRLKELGVKLAIDDFGTGFSSLTHLKFLPVDIIKIDRTFVSELENNLDDRAIVTAIIAMAQSLHLKVVAEGVETEEQHRLLCELGCDSMQGYLFGKPMDRPSFEQFLDNRQTHLFSATGLKEKKTEIVLKSDHIQVPFQEDRLLQHVTDITLKIPPLTPGDRLNTALDRFQTEKTLQVLPVVNQERVIGILNRSEFIEEQVVGRIGYAFHINHSKKVRDLMQPVPLVIDSEATIEEAATALHGKFGSMRLENICVARCGIYQGVLDVRTLLEGITALNLKLAKGANPLTGLPGNESIQREITRRLESGLPFEIAYIDIDNFKPYNDFYGFERGDMVIRVVGDILKDHDDSLLPGTKTGNFCGHIGGDDFIIITTSGNATALSRQVIMEFNRRLPVLHGSSDYTKGQYTSLNRKGELEVFNLLSLSVGVISTLRLKDPSYPRLASMASEVKKMAKEIKGSSVVFKDASEQAIIVIDNQNPI